MKKIIIGFLLALCNLVAFSQTEISKQIDEVTRGQVVSIKCIDANLIQVVGWEENYISLLAKVTINHGSNDDAYIIDITNENGSLRIDGSIRDKEKLPKMIQIKKGDQVYSFNTADMDSPEIQQFYKEQGRKGVHWVSHGVMWHIEYEIKVPQSINLSITSKHGLIEIDNYHGSIIADSKHGGVDMSISPNAKSEFNLKSDWGDVYTNIKLKYNEIKPGNVTEISCNMNGGGGPQVLLESKHGNIYLREMK